MGIFQKDISKAAYRDKLTCPGPNKDGNGFCGSEAVRYVENVGPFRLRYRCRKCGITFQYDISNRVLAHPYAPFKNQKFQDIVAMSKGGQHK